MSINSIRMIAGHRGVKYSRGQVSMESLLMVGFLLLLLIPILGYTLGMLSSESWKLDAQQANVAAKRIASIANRLSLGGEGTFSTETVFIPSSIINITTATGTIGEITFFIDAKELGIIEESAIADVPLALNPNSNWTNIHGMNVIMMNVTRIGSNLGVMLTK